MNNGRRVYIDILRVTAALFVIVIHVTSIGITDMDVGTTAWKLSNCGNSISRWAVPIFYMISGMMFLNPQKEISLNRLFKKKVSRIILCICIWGLFYSLLDQYVYGTISYKSILIAFYGILTGNTGYHLWFLYSILMLYVAVPALRIITKNSSRRQLEYILGIWFLIFICFGHINSIASELLGISQLLPYESYPITGYAGYFMLGDYLNRFPLKGTIKKCIYLMGAMCIIIYPFLSIVIPLKINVQYSSAILSINSLGSCVIAICVFNVMSEIKDESVSPILRKIVCFLSKLSFGVYLIHVFWVTVLFRIIKLNFTFANIYSGSVVKTNFYAIYNESGECMFCS